MSRWPLRIESGSSVAAKSCQPRLVVEQVHLRRRAGLEQVDDALRLRRESAAGRAGRSVARLQVVARAAMASAATPRPVAGLAEEMPACQSQFASRSIAHSFVTASSRFRIRLATVVYAASSRASSFAIARRFALRSDSFVAACRIALRNASQIVVEAVEQNLRFRSARRCAPSPAGSHTRSVAPELLPPSLHHPLGQLARGLHEVTSFIRFSACSGVLVRVSRTTQVSRPAASKFIIIGGGDGALPVGVQAAAVQARRRGPACSPSPPESSFQKPGGLVRLHRRPADLLHQQAGRRPAPGRASSRPAGGTRGPRASSRFSGSLLQQLRRRPSTTADRSRSSRSVFCMRLHVPAGAHELGGQPVEQLGMRRPFALRAEILDRLHQAGAEIHLPEAIHRHAGGQRIRRDRPASAPGPAGCSARPRAAAAARPARRASTFSPG